MTDFKSFYLISNSCFDQHPNNTLTYFTNTFPIPFVFDQSEKWEMGIESFGFSTNFSNIKYGGKNVPSFFVTTCRPETSKMNLILPNSYEDAELCNMKAFYLKQKFFKKGDLEDLRDEVLDKIPNSMSVTEDQITFSPSDQDYWVLMHQTFRDSFGFVGTVNSVNLDLNNPGSFITKIVLQKCMHDIRMCKYNDEIYYIFEVLKQSGKIVSDKFNLEEKIFPQLIKIQCDAIQSQIFNNTMTKDMIIFSPNFEQDTGYYFQEIESIDYIPLANTTLESITVTIEDESHQLLSLTKGHASIIKMNLRRVHPEKESFNIRVTSEPNKDYPDNNNTQFVNRLPYPLQLDSTWRVCLININYPSKFTTFLKDVTSRSISFKTTMRDENNEPRIFSHSFNPDIIYTAEGLTEELKNFLTRSRIGYLERDENGRLIIYLYVKGKLKISYFLARILGWDILTENEPAFIMKNTGLEDVDDPNRPRVVSKCEFKSSIDVNLLKPNYVMIYCNIIKSSLVGETYSKILKVAPIQTTNQQYVLKEFKTKEYKELENTEISEIEVHFRAHDGTPINFYGQQNVIVNMEFSNYQE